MLVVTSCTSDPPSSRKPTATSSSDSQRVQLQLTHCGVAEFQLFGRSWRLSPESPRYDSTNIPPSFEGEGTAEITHGGALRYVDDSGLQLAFVNDPGNRPDACD